LAVSIHGAIGLRTVLFEWFGIKGNALEGIMWAIGLALFVLGARAVWAVTIATGVGA
jgi:fumarate reductase subunit C